MKVIIAGSRVITDRELVETAIRDSGFNVTEIVCGMSGGVDIVGFNWAKDNNIPVKKFPSNWRKYGKADAPIRNRKMAEYSDALVVIMFPRSKVAKNMVETANTLGLKIHQVIMGHGLEERFWDNVNVVPSECWEWTGHKFYKRGGYGAFWVKKGKIVRAHRYSWELHNGPIPSGMHICHTCDNTGCVNPDHLFMGTNLDNIRDKIKKNRMPKGKDLPQTKLNEGIVREIRRRYKKEKISHKALANIYGVSNQQISRVITKKDWTHIEDK